ncbi:MAG: hypothetical protein FJW40_02125 [Acidobacteria bacterium]|nr:hypothetical protein [Acidobacteriota bacterium]
MPAWLCKISLYLAASSAVLAQIPAEDRRNTVTPNTDTRFELPRYATLAQWEARKAHLRRQILSATGLLPMPARTPLNPRVDGKVERDGYTIENVVLETIPGYFLAGNLYRPASRTGKLPGILLPHGHWRNGRIENTQNYSGIALGANLARQGFVAFGYDMVGYNDTSQTPHSFGQTPAEQLWAFNPYSLQTWNSIRALDYLASLPDVDTARLGATGASGGGTQTFTLAAIDNRIAFAAPVNMVSAIMQGGSPCENISSLRLDTSNVEFAAMLAPKPQHLVAATGDWTRNVPREEFPAIQAIYALYDRTANVTTEQFEAPHNYHRESRESVYRFLAKAVRAAEESPRDRGWAMEEPETLRVYTRKPMAAGALDFQGVFAAWKRMTAPPGQRPNVLRDRLMAALAVEWPEQVLEQGSGRDLLLGRAGKGDRIPAMHRAGQSKRWILAVHAGGSAAALDLPASRETGDGNVLAIDAFQTGRAAAARDRSHRYFLTFNRSDDAERVQDILTALRYLSSRGAESIEIAATGNAAVWSYFAAAVAPVKVSLKAPLGGFQGTDEDFAARFFVPAIQRAGGLEAARLLVEGGLAAPR